MRPDPLLPMAGLPAPRPEAAAGPRPGAAPADETALMEAAKALEASFLAEMLKSTGLGEMPSEFGGGAGEEQFASFLREEQARAMVAAGGIGLAEQLFASLVSRADG
ncbi:rod-binding protein [Pseudoroseicyclus sp. CXY001]|uniref:rod-binding protein n=1 Tax=Pseudoroseicyclus sp. CXY001 TaxID=3242492 RepID=UPI003570E79E